MATSFLRIGVDSRQAVTGFRQYERASKSARGETTAFDKRLRGTEGGFKKFSAAAIAAKTAVAGLATGALVLAAKRMFEVGSAAEETASKYNTVFGPSVGRVNEFLDEFAIKAGLTTRAAQDLTATTGAIAQGFGFAGDEAAQFAIEVAKLSGDLASFNNREIQDAFAAVRSGITGEREALKQLGIVLLESDVQQRALANSAKQAASELTQQDKATASLQLITERAGVAIGDLDRTQDSAANTARRVAARFKELEEALATALLPLFGELLTALDEQGDGFITLAQTIRGYSTEVAVAAIEARKFFAVFTADLTKPVSEFKRLVQLFEDSDQRIARLRATASGIYDQTAADAGLLAQLFGISAEAAETLAAQLDASAAASGTFAKNMQDAADATREAVVEIGKVTVIGPDGFPVPQIGLARPGDPSGRTNRLGGQQFGTDAFGLGTFGLQQTIDEVQQLVEESANFGEVARSAVPGVVSLADGLLDLDPAVRSALRGIGDIAVGLDNLGQGSFLKNLPGILGVVGGGINLLGGIAGGLFGGGDEQRFLDAQREAAKRALELADALREATEAVRRDLDVRELRVQGLNREADVLRFQRGQAQEREDFFGDIAGASGDFLAPAIRETLDDIIGRGLTGEDAFNQFVNEATFLGGTGNLNETLDAIREYIRLVGLQGAELEEFNRRQQEAIDQQRLTFEQDIERRRARVTGDFETELEIQRDRELAAAQELVDQGVITQEMFTDLAEVLDLELGAALEAAANAANRAALELEAANRALEDDIRVRSLAVNGLDDEAATLRKEIDQRTELNQAIEAGLDPLLIDQLRQVQQAELEQFVAGLDGPSRRRTTPETAAARTRAETVSVTATQETTAIGLLNTSRSMLVQLREINLNTRPLRRPGLGGLDEALGASAFTQSRLAGRPA
jgi:hypothetical protein